MVSTMLKLKGHSVDIFCHCKESSSQFKECLQAPFSEDDDAHILFNMDADIMSEPDTFADSCGMLGGCQYVKVLLRFLLHQWEWPG